MLPEGILCKKSAAGATFSNIFIWSFDLPPNNAVAVGFVGTRVGQMTVQKPIEPRPGVGYCYGAVILKFIDSIEGPYWFWNETFALQNTFLPVIVSLQAAALQNMVICLRDIDFYGARSIQYC